MVIGQFHPIIGGAERQAQKLATALLERGVSVRVVTIRSRGLPSAEVIDRIPVDRVTSLRVAVRGRSYFSFYTSMISLYRYLLRHGRHHDLFHVHQVYSPAFVATWAGRKLSKPVLAKVGNSGERFDLEVLSGKWPLGPHMVTYVRNHLDVVVATSKLMEEELRNFGFAQQKIKYIPNGVMLPRLPSVQERARVRESLGVSPDNFVLTFVGSFQRKKNVPFLLNTFASLARERSQVRLWLVGDGPQRNLLQQQVIQLDLTGKVRFTGQIPNVSDYLMASDGFVLPSRIEGLSNALLEAMSHGLPCVATAVGGNPDLIHSGKNGWLVPPEDPNALYETLKRVSDNSDAARAAGHAARATIAERFTIDQVADKYLDLYDQLLERAV